MVKWLDKFDSLGKSDFEIQCQKASAEVAKRARGGDGDNSSRPVDESLAEQGGVKNRLPWPLESFVTLRGNEVVRVRSTFFYLCSLLSFSGGLFLFSEKASIAAFLVLTASPFFLLYPLVRLLFGGKDSVGAVVVTAIAQEVIKGKIVKAIEDSSRRKRR